MSEHIAFVTISVGAALLLLFWSTWSFVLTACHVLHCHRGVCRAILVILSANSSSPPALYSVLIISPLSCPHVCCLVSVRMLCSEAQFISLLIILADPVSFCLSCQSGAPVFAILPFRYMPASLGEDSSLPWRFPDRMPVSSQYPLLFISARIRHSLWIRGSCLLTSRCLSAPLARLKPVCLSRCGSGLFSGSLCHPADFGTESFCFLFQ